MSNISFEDALKKLEEYSDKIKSPDTNLEESITCYEDGMKYFHICNNILNDARQKIETFEKEEVGYDEREL